MLIAYGVILFYMPIKVCFEWWDETYFLSVTNTLAVINMGFKLNFSYYKNGSIESNRKNIIINYLKT